MLAHLVPWVYNALMAIAILAAVIVIAKERSARAWSAALLGLTLAAAALILLLVRDPFAALDLVAYTVFVHLPIVLLMSSRLLKAKRRGLARLSGVAGLALVGIALDAFWLEPHWLEVCYYRVSSPKIHRPVRIVLLADLQTDHFTGYEEEVIRRALREKPDLILWAGDYLQVDATRRPALRKQVNDFLNQLDLTTPLGSFAIRGNVDRENWAEMFHGLPVHTVERSESFDLEPLRLTCLSSADSFSWDLHLPPPADDKFRIILGHSPGFAFSSVEGDLFLAGHTHGGQVRIPGIGPATTMSAVPRRFGAGLNDRPGGGKLLVSRGIGMERETAPRLRFLCRPELTVIDVVPEGGRSSRQRKAESGKRKGESGKRKAGGAGAGQGRGDAPRVSGPVCPSPTANCLLPTAYYFLPCPIRGGDSIIAQSSTANCPLRAEL